jgi:hypothetical protein
MDWSPAYSQNTTDNQQNYKKSSTIKETSQSETTRGVPKEIITNLMQNNVERTLIGKRPL